MQTCIVNRPRVELLAKGYAFRLEFLALSIELPSLAENIFNAFHICQELSLNLPSPNHGTYDCKVGLAFETYGKRQVIDIEF